MDAKQGAMRLCHTERKAVSIDELACTNLGHPKGLARL